MGSSWCFENDPSCVVLYSLQLLDAVAGSAVEHSIAVVDPGVDFICDFLLVGVISEKCGRVLEHSVAVFLGCVASWVRHWMTAMP